MKKKDDIQRGKQRKRWSGKGARETGDRPSHPRPLKSCDRKETPKAARFNQKSNNKQKERSEKKGARDAL